MSIQARIAAWGIQPVIDALTAAGDDARQLRALAWGATWCRGYDDVAVPAPVPSVHIDGYTIAARAFPSGRSALVLDGGSQLWAVAARGAAPPPGTRVRITAGAAGAAPWDVKVLDAVGLGLTLRFGLLPPAVRMPWVAELRTIVAGLRAAETESRRDVDARRAALGSFKTVPPLLEELHERERVLRARIETETVLTAEERTAYDLGTDKMRAAVLAAFAARRRARYETAVAALRAQVPALAADHARRVAASHELRRTIQALEAAGAASRTRLQRMDVLERQLDAIAVSGLHAEWDAAARLAAGPASFDDVARTIDVLFGLIPRRRHKVRSAS